MADYLKRRKQRVKIGNCRSSWADLHKGVPQGSILGPVLFNIFMNDLFLFINNCNFYNYADDNPLSFDASSLQTVLQNLQEDCKTAIQWFGDNGMKAKPKKFQFMILSPNQHEVTHLKLCDDISINSESSVKVLGVIVDNRLTFTEHISRCCKKAARQLNALSRIAKYLDMKSKKLIFNSFIMSNFNYCPLVWHFCGKGNNNKLEQIQERSLRTLLSDTRSDYESLLDTFSTIPLLTSRLKYMTLEAVRSVRQENAACLHDMFHVNQVPYEMRWNKIIQPKMKTTTHGLRFFSYLGAKLLNDLLKEIPDVCDLQTEFTEYEMKNLIKCWEGPMIDNTYAYVWSRPKGRINNKPTLVEVMAWRRTGDKPLIGPLLAQFTDAYMQHWGRCVEFPYIILQSAKTDGTVGNRTHDYPQHETEYESKWISNILLVPLSYLNATIHVDIKTGKVGPVFIDKNKRGWCSWN